MNYVLIASVGRCRVEHVRIVVGGVVFVDVPDEDFPKANYYILSLPG